MHSKLNLTIFSSDNHQHARSRTSQELQEMKELLNSQRIKLIFNHYDLEVLLQKDDIRISNLHSNNIMRTCAFVNYCLPVPKWFETTHEKIYDGGSIGQTIKENGFNLVKEEIYFGQIKLPEFAKLKMETNENTAAVYLYKLMVNNPKLSEQIPYCTISEIYSPSFLTLGDLKALYPEKIENYSIITEAVQKHLEDLSILDNLLINSKNSSNFELNRAF